METKIILVRHAQAEGNINRFFHGWTDSPLTDLGHKQAELAAKKLESTEIDCIYSSPLKRAVQTAEHIASVKCLGINIIEDLKEINGGDWEEQPFAELPVKWPLEFHTWENEPENHCMPNGETILGFHDRLVKAVDTIINSCQGKKVCIITHGTSIKALLCHFRRCRLNEMINIRWSDNTAITKVCYDGKTFTVETESDALHLGREYSTILNQPWWNEYIAMLEARKAKHI